MIKGLRFATTVLLAAGSLCAAAQDFPSRPIHIISPYVAGGSTDIMLRAMSPRLQGIISQPIVIEQKTGASGVVAAEYVAKAPPDGYTLLVAEQGAMALQAVYIKKMPYDSLRDIPPFIIIAESTQMFASPVSAPWNSVPEMVAYAKANPGKVNFGVPGIQSLQALFVDVLNQRYHIDLTTVPYKGLGEIIPAILGGQVQLASFTLALATENKDKIKILAVTGQHRLSGYPSAPTFIELGRPEIVSSLITLSAPSATPRTVVDRLYTSFSATLAEPEMKDSLTQMGYVMNGASRDDTLKIVRALHRSALEVAHNAGIKPE